VDLSIHHYRWDAAGCWCAHERAVVRFTSEQVAGFSRLLRRRYILFMVMFLMFPKPLPTVSDLGQMPWWAPIGGLVGAVQVYAGLTLVQRVGAGPFMGLTVTAALVASILIDHCGWFHMPVHPINACRIAGAILMIGGIALITRF
jgi:transporter family-2 protein